MRETVDVLVVGAGPAGASTAIRLAQAGLTVRLVDRARFPRPKPCAEYLSPGTLAELHQLGVLDQVDRAGGVPLRGTAVLGPHGSQLTGLFAMIHPAPLRSSGLAMPRSILDALLVEAARAGGVEVCEATTVESLLEHRGGVTGVVLRHQDARTHTAARLVVGADGIRSVVARRLGGRRQGRIRRMALVAHMSGVADMRGRAELHVGAAEYVGLNPLPNGCTNVAVVIPVGQLAGMRGDPPACLRQRLAGYSALAARTDQARFESPVRATGPFAYASRRVIADGAMLVGDAAEFFDPFTGEGIYSALRGGALAAEAAVAALHGGGAASAERLRPYLAARRRAFRGKWLVERLIGHALESPRLFDRLVRGLERQDLGHTLVGVTGNCLPARAVLNWRLLAAMAG